MNYKDLSIKENARGAGEYTINYNRDNLKNSKKVFIHYGINGWQDVNEIEMLNTPQGFEAKINVPEDVTKFNFTFRDEYNNWDNNDNQNFEFDIDPKKEEIKYFANDFLLKYTEDISFNNKENEETKVKEKNEKVETNSKGLSLEELEDISFDHTKEELDKSIEAKFAKLFGKLEEETASSLDLEENTENNNNIEIEEAETKEDEYKLVPIKFTSDIPYVSLFKQAKEEAMLSFEELNNVSDEYEPIVYTSNINLIEVMRMEAKRKWVLMQAARNENQEFALVKAFNPVEEYDNSLIGMVKQYITSIVQSFKKLVNIISEDLNPASNENK